MKIILIIGLPGSGKTWLADEYSALSQVTVVDDIAALDQLPEYEENLILVITDVNFCDATILERAEGKFREQYGDIEINKVYFENDAIAARKNVLYRNDGRNVEGTIRRFASIYHPPAGSRLIWNQE